MSMSIAGDMIPSELVQFEGLTINQMVSVFAAGERLLGKECELTRFRSRAEGLRRLETCRQALVKMHGWARVVDEDWEIEKPAAAAEPAKAGRAKLDLSRKITVLVEENPKRAGSRSFVVFALYRNGMTVGEFVEAVVAAGYDRKLAVLDLNWNLVHGFLALS